MQITLNPEVQVSLSETDLKKKTRSQQMIAVYDHNKLPQNVHRFYRKSSSQRWIRLQSQKQHKSISSCFSADDSRRNVRFLVVKLTYACDFLLLVWRMSLHFSN